MTKKLAEMEVLIKWILGVPNPLRKSHPYNYADSLFVDAITFVEIPKKFSFPNMKLYSGTTDPMDHITSYKQRMFTTVIPCDL